MKSRILKRNHVWKVMARYAMLPLRLVVGYGFLAHGLAKWSKGPAAFASILHAVGVPAPQLMAWTQFSSKSSGERQSCWVPLSRW